MPKKKKERATQARMMQIRALIYKIAWSVLPMIVLLPHRTFITGLQIMFSADEVPYRERAIFCFVWVTALMIGSFVIQLVVDAIYGKNGSGDSIIVFAPRADSFMIKLTNILLIIEAISLVPVFIGLIIHSPIKMIILIAAIVLFGSRFTAKVIGIIKKIMLFVLTILLYVPITIYEKLIKGKNIL